MNDSQNILAVYMTASGREEAEKIAECLVKEKLAACVNILGPVSSVYAWEGKLEHAEEVAFIAKTVAGKYAQLEARVKELHSYECPCVVAYPVGAGYAPYLNWVKDSVS